MTNPVIFSYSCFSRAVRTVYSSFTTTNGICCYYATTHCYYSTTTAVLCTSTNVLKYLLFPLLSTSTSYALPTSSWYHWLYYYCTTTTTTSSTTSSSRTTSSTVLVQTSRAAGYYRAEEGGRSGRAPEHRPAH